ETETPAPAAAANATPADPVVDDGRAQPDPQPETEPEPESSVEPASPSELQTIVRRARELLLEFHGADAEAVSSVTRTARGCAVGLELVEMRRIPDSMDILAPYEVELDGAGGILRFERTRRYHRSEADAGGRR